MTFDQTGAQPREQLAATVRAAVDAGVTPVRHRRRLRARRRSRRQRSGRERAAHRRTARRARRALGGLAGHQGRPRPHRRRRLGASTAPRPPPCRGRRAAQRLGVEQIALWQHHRPDPKRRLRRHRRHAQGDPRLRARSRMVGISNAELRPDPARALRPRRRAGERPERVLARLPLQPARDRRLRGARPRVPAVVTARRARQRQGTGDKHPAFKAVADDHGVSAQQVALAWELAQSPVVIPIPGAKRPTVDHGLRRGGRPRALRRRARCARRLVGLLSRAARSPASAAPRCRG